MMLTKVMIVDDERSFADTLAERLKIRDYHVAAAYDGRQALELVKKSNFDVVVLDVSMPEVDGIQVLREIKQIKPLTEVIMLTGKATVETAIEGMKLGALDYLMKPCETEDLTEKIDMAYKRKSEHEQRIQEARMKEIISSPRSVFKS